MANRDPANLTPTRIREAKPRATAWVLWGRQASRVRGAGVSRREQGIPRQIPHHGRQAKVVHHRPRRRDPARGGAQAGGSGAGGCAGRSRPRPAAARAPAGSDRRGRAGQVLCRVRAAACRGRSAFGADPVRLSEAGGQNDPPEPRRPENRRCHAGRCRAGACQGGARSAQPATRAPVEVVQSLGKVGMVRARAQPRQADRAHPRATPRPRAGAVRNSGACRRCRGAG